MAKNFVHLTKWGSDPYVYSLQRYQLRIEIPVTAVARDTQSFCQGLLTVEYLLKEHDKNKIQSQCFLDSEPVSIDDTECSKFCLTMGDQEYCADRPSTYFEQSLLQINAKCREKYLLKCCFTCIRRIFLVNWKDLNMIFSRKPGFAIPLKRGFTAKGIVEKYRWTKVMKRQKSNGG